MLIFADSPWPGGGASQRLQVDPHDLIKRACQPSASRSPAANLLQTEVRFYAGTHFVEVLMRDRISPLVQTLKLTLSVLVLSVLILDLVPELDPPKPEIRS